MHSVSVNKKIKLLLRSSLYYAGYFDVLRKFQSSRVPMLMYHRFSLESEPFKVSLKIFDQQICFLQKKYNFITFSNYLRALCDSSYRLPPNSLLLTIDDGFRDNYEYAYPVLRKYNVPATIFLTTDFISHRAWLWSNRLEYILKNSHLKSFEFPIPGSQNFFQVDSFAGWHSTQLLFFNYCRNLDNQLKDDLLEELARALKVQVPDTVTSSYLPLTWEQVREMKVGGIEFGSHTCSHPICSRLTCESLNYELSMSKKVIEENISEEVNIFCYPNGQSEDISEEVVTQVKSQGYRAAVTTNIGYNIVNKTDPYYLKRCSLGEANFAVISRALTVKNRAE